MFSVDNPDYIRARAMPTRCRPPSFNPTLRDPTENLCLFQRPTHPDGTIWVFDCVCLEWFVAESYEEWEKTLQVIEFPDILRFVEAAKTYAPAVKEKRSA
jgi:hypothetical protein